MAFMPETQQAPQRSRIATAKERADRAKTVILAVAVIAFFGAMAAERGAQHNSTSSGSSQPATSSDEDDSFGFFDDDGGGLAPSQGQPPTSTQTS
jgi:hypothetical protein